MIHLTFKSSKALQSKRSKIHAPDGLSVPVHFHFGYYAQTTSKDFVK